jgi:signal transduction histidine kinase
LVVGAVSLGVFAHRARTAVLEKRNRELQALKDQRERALAEARASEKALHAAYGRLRDLTRRLEAAKEEERKRIARELHDEMGQALTAAKINLQILSGIDDRDARVQRIVDTVGLVDRMISHVRALSLDLRPPLLDELGVVPAVRGYLEAQANRSGIDIDVDAEEVPSLVPADAAIVAFRVVQESITNVIRHADASRAEVTMRYDPGWLDLSIRDNGRGFDVDEAFERASAGHHLGLLGIQERVQALGGEVEILSSAGRGTEVRVRVPLAG